MCNSIIVMKINGLVSLLLVYLDRCNLKLKMNPFEPNIAKNFQKKFFSDFESC